MRRKPLRIQIQDAGRLALARLVPTADTVVIGNPVGRILVPIKNHTEVDTLVLIGVILRPLVRAPVLAIARGAISPGSQGITGSHDEWCQTAYGTAPMVTVFVNSDCDGILLYMFLEKYVDRIIQSSPRDFCHKDRGTYMLALWICHCHIF